MQIFNLRAIKTSLSFSLFKNLQIYFWEGAVLMHSPWDLAGVSCWLNLVYTIYVHADSYPSPDSFPLGS